MQSKYMKKCFSLAKKGGMDVLPNPLVGCVIVKDDKIIAQGCHKKYGDFHAERNALLNCEDTKGATLYVNLEPCSHFGKTPPCVDLIIEKKISRVVFSNYDPNPLVSGSSKLKEAGIEVISGVLEKEGKELNKVFFKNMRTKTPYVALKTATTLDAKTACNNYNSKWITGETSRKKVMELRSSYQAILTGSNTVIYDNPHLTSRIEGGKNPIRIVTDRRGVLKGDENVFNDDGVKVFVINNTDKKYPKNVEKLPELDLKLFYEKGIYSILTEAGGRLNSELIKLNAVDEIYHFIAPKILGGGIDFVSGFDKNNVSEAINVKDLKMQKVGDDILLNYKL